MDPAVRAYISRRLREAALEKGREEGRASGRAVSVLQILGHCEIEVTDADRARVLGCTDIETLTRWLDRALDAERVAEVFAE